MTTETYQALRKKLYDEGYFHEIEWAQNVKPVADAHNFWLEYAWVVLNSGMKNQVAQMIWDKVRPVVEAGRSASEVFRHEGKCKAIDYVWQNREKLFQDYLKDDDKIEFLKILPYIGEITCWHLAKNFGFDCAKPDRHLVRIAAAEGVDPMCRRLAQATGDRIATVDLVIWRAANLGLV